MADMLLISLAEGIFFGFVLLGFIGTGIALRYIILKISSWRVNNEISR